MKSVDSLDGEEYGIHACLLVANWLQSRGRIADAERVYKLALRQADALEGEESPLTGLVLLDLHDFYEKQGRHDEAAPAWERVR
ncbi:tetratricopeptide repeat protein, partial [Acinetobacter baumannii]